MANIFVENRREYCKQRSGSKRTSFNEQRFLSTKKDSSQRRTMITKNRLRETNNMVENIILDKVGSTKHVNTVNEDSTQQTDTKAGSKTKLNLHSDNNINSDIKNQLIAQDPRNKNKNQTNLEEGNDHIDVSKFKKENQSSTLKSNSGKMIPLKFNSDESSEKELSSFQSKVSHPKLQSHRKHFNLGIIEKENPFIKNDFEPNSMGSKVDSELSKQILSLKEMKTPKTGELTGKKFSSFRVDDFNSKCLKQETPIAKINHQPEDKRKSISKIKLKNKKKRKVRTLKQLLDFNFEDEYVENFHCEGCSKTTMIKKSIKILKDPKILNIVLARTSYNFETLKTQKNRIPILMEDNEINLDDYKLDPKEHGVLRTNDMTRSMFNTNLEEEEHNVFYRNDFTMNGTLRNQKSTYQMFSYNEHRGRADNGHYVAFVKNRNCYFMNRMIQFDQPKVETQNSKNKKNNTKNKDKFRADWKWFTINDEKVYKISNHDLRYKNPNRNVYSIFYQKKREYL